MTNFIALMKIDELFTSGKIPLSPKIIPMLEKLADKSKNNFIINLLDLIKGKIKNNDDIEWGNYKILKEEFSKYKLNDLTKCKGKTLVDLFNYNSPITDKIESYDTYGPLLTLEKDIEMEKKYNEDVNSKKVKNFLLKNFDDEVDKLNEEYKYEEKDLLGYESWMLL